MDIKRILYKLYSDVYLTKGYSRSIMFDTSRNNYYFIPNDLFEILNIENPIDFFEIAKELSKESINILKDYKNFLLSNDLIFEILESENLKFPKVSTEWYSPYKISNIILDVDFFTNLDYLSKIEEEIEYLGVESLQIRIFSPARFLDLEQTIYTFNNSVNNKLKDLQIEICSFKKEDIYLINKIKKIADLPIISSINIYSEKFEFIIKYSKINFFNKKVINHKSCGEISGNINAINKKIIHESINFNSCLNCKTSVDSEGFIKNCPSMSQSFGNIKDTSLKEAIKHNDYKKYWKLNKDKIEICKDCEFRYICTDCRAYTEGNQSNSEGLDTSKPLKCGYDPFTGKWEEWKTNIKKLKEIKFYEMQEII